MNRHVTSTAARAFILPLLSSILCTMVVLDSRPAAAAEVFFEPGMFSIDTPEADDSGVPFTWKKLQTVQNAETTTHYFICMQEDRSSPLLLLMVDERQASTTGQRRAIIKAHFKALQGIVVKSGFKIDSPRPKIKTPVPERVFYGVAGSKEDGAKMFVAGMILFKNRIYMLQSSASSAAEAKRLLAVGNSFQELYEPNPLAPASGAFGP